MMTKKNYVLQALATLEEYWPIAKDLAQLVDHNVFNNEMISSIQQIISKTVSGLVDEAKKAKLQDAFSELERIKAMEEKVREEEKAELSELESLIENGGVDEE